MGGFRKGRTGLPADRNIVPREVNGLIRLGLTYVFSEDMALLALLTRDGEVEGTVRKALEHRHAVARIGGWDRFILTLRERPVTGAVVDEGALPVPQHAPGYVAELRRRFPSLAPVWLARRASDPMRLLQLGRAGIHHMLLASVDDLSAELPGCVGRSLAATTEALVTRQISPYLPPRALLTVRLALDGIHRNLSAEGLAGLMELSRPHLSVGLRKAGLPSAGHLLVWARLLHAGRWLSDPGRSAESVSRQLDYANGASFRRALRNYVGTTPTQVTAGGGLPVVLACFLRRCGVGRPGGGRSAA